MPHRDGRGGTLILDRVTPVGRLKRATGTRDVRVARRLGAMITDLIDAARHDYLRAIRSGQLRPLDVYQVYRGATSAAGMPAVDQLQPLGAALTAWAAQAECGERHRATHRTFVRRVMEAALSAPGAAVSELPALLEVVRGRYKARKQHAAFNRLRASALSFARDTLRRSHPVYGALIDVPPLRERKGRVNRPQSPAEIATIVRSSALTEGDRAAVWGMALTGMGPGEWFGRWHIESDRIHIDGTKREGRVRDVPRVLSRLFTAPGEPEKPLLPTPRAKAAEWPIRLFARALKGASGGAVQPYDLRRTYATWMEEAGISRTRRRSYLGHATGDVTDRYEAQDVTRYLMDDAARLTAWIESQLFVQIRPDTAPEPPREGDR